MTALTEEFFRRDPAVCARELIGAEFEWDGCGGKIVETEAYAAIGDEACHTFSRPSARRFVEENPAGTSYVYLNYGVHWLFNILVKGESGDGFVLFRALEPTQGVEEMRSRRPKRSDRELCAGPGRLTQALGIDGRVHACRFLGEKGRQIVVFQGSEVIADSRIGISKAKSRPWRFSEAGSRFVSQKPKV